MYEYVRLSYGNFDFFLILNTCVKLGALFYFV